jgi:hypothetical protein
MTTATDGEGRAKDVGDKTVGEKMDVADPRPVTKYDRRAIWAASVTPSGVRNTRGLLARAS